ncbi:hypothetical protein SDC9_68490 [bioreactor metagenome]|uniref:Uncharacterized protein n=1 Tax=bioreactor metagenome TaxID=1076179 RepID=A0A644Y0K4_9ZZZZ
MAGFHQFLAELVEDGRWGARWCEHAVPGGELHAWIARFGRRGNVGEHGWAGGAGGQQRFQASGFDQRHRCGVGKELCVDVAVQQAGDLLASGAEVNRFDLRADGFGKQIGPEMSHGAGAGSAEEQRGLLARPGCELCHVLDGHVLRVDEQRQVGSHDLRDGREIALGVVRHLADVRKDCHLRHGSDQQGVAIGRGARHFLGGNHAASARLVLHHHAVLEALFKVGSNHARHHVCAACGRVAHQQSHWFCGEFCVGS